MASYKKNLLLVKEHLQENETIITSIEGTYVKNDWTRSGILVATESRIIFFGNKFIGFDLETFPFSNISSYELSKEFLGHKIKFFASGNKVEIKWIQSKNYNEFNQYINANIGQQSNVIQTESVASQLEKLAALLDKNLISKVEFMSMKDELTINNGQAEALEPVPNYTYNKSTAHKPQKKSGFKKFLKIAFIIFFIITMAIGMLNSLFSDNDNDNTKYNNHQLKYAKSSLNIRSEPIIGDNIVKVIAANDKVFTYDSIVNNYILVLDKDSSLVGWASSKYLQKKPLTKSQLTPIKTTKKIVLQTFKIINKTKNKALKKVSVDIRLTKESTTSELTNIAKEIKRNNPQYTNYYIFYFLPGQTPGNGAWATSHFTPNLEVSIIGASKEAIIKMENVKISGDIKGTWFDNDVILPNTIYLVSINNQLYFKTIFAKSKYSNGSEIKSKVTSTKSNNGKTIYTYSNDHGEYFAIERNGNLGLYNDEGKFKEAVKK